MKISCVIDNTTEFATEFYSEHGLSFLIEKDDYKILFDTGRTPEVLKKNMEILNGFEDLKYVVLSHGHEDHTGGLQYIYDNTSATILLHEKTFVPKYLVKDDSTRFIGTQLKRSKTDDTESELKFVNGVTEIAPDIYIFGDITMENDFEYLDPLLQIKNNDKLSTDSFDEEQVLVIKTDDGLIVLSGCAHKGIVNTVSSVRKYFKEDIYAVIGGTHLVTADEIKLNKTVTEIEEFDPEYLMFGHCNGFDANCRFKKEFGDKFQIIASGRVTLEI